MQLKGYKILERRYKTRVGEIDLIARRNNMIIFVEVKARKIREEALESITPKMKLRIVNTARYYLAHNIADGDVQFRFDVVAIMPATLSHMKQGQFFIHHLDNAWSATA